MSTTNSADLPISQELLDILRCPLAVQEKTKYGDDPGKLELAHNTWLVSADSGLKYPIRDGIPIMLIDEGMKWKNTAVDALPVPPPTPTPAPTTTASASTNPAPTKSNKKYKIIGAILLTLFILRRKKKKARS